MNDQGNTTDNENIREDLMDQQDDDTYDAWTEEIEDQIAERLSKLRKSNSSHVYHPEDKDRCQNHDKSKDCA